MSTRDIPARRWPEFLDDFSQGHRSWLTTIESASPDAPPRVEAVERPLRSVTPKIEGGRVVTIEIRLQEDSEAREAVRIDAPAVLRVDETAEGVARGLEVVDEDGDCMRLRFRAAPRPSEILDGIAPGELSANEDVTP